MIGNKNLAIAVDFETIRLAVIFTDQLCFTLRRDAKNQAKGDIHQVKIALAVKRGALYIAVSCGMTLARLYAL